MQNSSFPRISVVIPVRNSERTLPQSLDSVFAQTVQPYEIIVVDGLSTDGTVDLLKRHGDKLKWISESDSGTSDAINKGFALATGDYVTVLLADDFFPDEHVFEKMAAKLSAEPAIDLLFSTMRRIDPEGLAPTKEFPSSLEAMPRRAALNLPGALFKKSALKGDALNPSVKIANDYEFICRLVYDRGLKVGILPDVTMVMRLGGMSGDVRNDFKHSYEKFVIRRKYFGLATALKYGAGAFLVSTLRRLHFRPFTWYRKTKRLLRSAA
jgi:glycosyltransferase involved in cell wall biosynthesis